MLDMRNFGIYSPNQIIGDWHAPTDAIFDASDDPAVATLLCQQFTRAAWRSVTEWLAFVAKHDLGGPKDTIASQGWHTFRYRFLPDRIKPHGKPEVHALERAGYFGGRCETRYIGLVTSKPRTLYEEANMQYGCRRLFTGSPIYHYDVNSLYPYCAAAESMPAELLGVADLGDKMFSPGMIQSSCSLAEVLLATDTPMYPRRVSTDTHTSSGRAAVPVYRCNGGWHSRTIWPTGSFWTVLAGPELTLAVESGHVAAVGRVAIYRMQTVFADFVRFLYDLRKLAKETGNGILNSQCKAMMNTCLGRVAQRKRGWQDQPKDVHCSPWDAWYERDPDTGCLCPWRCVAGLVQKFVDHGEHADSMPAVGAWITSAARVHLWRILEKCGRENVFYYDTDSVFTNSNGKDRLERNGLIGANELGKLRHVATLAELEVRGWKHYVADGVVKCSGLPDATRIAPSGAAYARVPSKLMSDLAAGQSPQATVSLIWLHYFKTYKHGRIEWNGVVKPHRIDETLLGNPFREIHLTDPKASVQ
jgi:DNA polymerase family B